MSQPELQGLEGILAGLDLPGRRASVVAHDARRGWWFRWNDTELSVSEKILERCPPADAEILLTHAVFEQRGLRRLTRRKTFGFLVTLGLLAVLGTQAPQVLALVLGGLAILVYLVAMLIERSRVRLRADDQTVAHLGDAEGLVRALNLMDVDQVQIGSYRSSVRPDIHKRAERLVRRHDLCSASIDDTAEA